MTVNPTITKMLQQTDRHYRSRKGVKNGRGVVITFRLVGSWTIVPIVFPTYTEIYFKSLAELNETCLTFSQVVFWLITYRDRHTQSITDTHTDKCRRTQRNTLINIHTTHMGTDTHTPAFTDKLIALAKTHWYTDTQGGSDNTTLNTNTLHYLCPSHS